MRSSGLTSGGSGDSLLAWPKPTRGWLCDWLISAAPGRAGRGLRDLLALAASRAASSRASRAPARGPSPGRRGARASPSRSARGSSRRRPWSAATGQRVGARPRRDVAHGAVEDRERRVVERRLAERLPRAAARGVHRRQVGLARDALAAARRAHGRHARHEERGRRRVGARWRGRSEAASASSRRIGSATAPGGGGVREEGRAGEGGGEGGREHREDEIRGARRHTERRRSARRGRLGARAAPRACGTLSPSRRPCSAPTAARRARARAACASPSRSRCPGCRGRSASSGPVRRSAPSCRIAAAPAACPRASASPRARAARAPTRARATLGDEAITASPTPHCDTAALRPMRA